MDTLAIVGASRPANDATRYLGATLLIAPLRQRHLHRSVRAIDRLAVWLRAHPAIAAVGVVGIVVRIVLVPITQGRDFSVWDLASRATLDGINIYAHHPPYPGGPYAYFPLFLYIELPMQWLSIHTGMPFRMLGKLPIIAGDVLTTALIVAFALRNGHSDKRTAVMASLYFLNPLALYNGAFYGRFDSVCLGLLMLALYTLDHEHAPTWRFHLPYSLAAACKTFPLILLPWLLVRLGSGRLRMAGILLLVLAGISLPYLITSPLAFFADVVVYNSQKPPGNLSWQLALASLPPGASRLVSYGAVGLLVIGLLYFTRLDDPAMYALVAVLLVLCASKVVLEQYLLWPIPLLVLSGLKYPSRGSIGMIAALTMVGSLINPYVHPFGEQPISITVPFALLLLAYAVTRTRTNAGFVTGGSGAPPLADD